MNHSTSATANDTPRWPTPDFLRLEQPSAARIADWVAGTSHNTAVNRQFGEQVAVLRLVAEIARRTLNYWLADLDPIQVDHHDGLFLHCVAARILGADVREQT
ncbi:hypothetical protein [Amycolatopsis sp. CA-230715]|uniref:hypothetical protein n=1 Tax=Amycolatopsis sp. CA-230715 TaxID=2745196 RepID=UPI001C03195F|nr:hypothetical protein [Amycolatopsis sp. CA-230715]QWF81077.1 hypothetical protein HUW46_04502 [Amycolatopsis sp. CA-230715]